MHFSKGNRIGRLEEGEEEEETKNMTRKEGTRSSTQPSLKQANMHGPSLLAVENGMKSKHTCKSNHSWRWTDDELELGDEERLGEDRSSQERNEKSPVIDRWRPQSSHTKKTHLSSILKTKMSFRSMKKVEMISNVGISHQRMKKIADWLWDAHKKNRPPLTIRHTHTHTHTRTKWPGTLKVVGKLSESWPPIIFKVDWLLACLSPTLIGRVYTEKRCAKQ